MLGCHYITFLSTFFFIRRCSESFFLIIKNKNIYNFLRDTIKHFSIYDLKENVIHIKTFLFYWKLRYHSNYKVSSNKADDGTISGLLLLFQAFS